MAPMKRQASSQKISVRPTADDSKIVGALRKKLGVDVSQILRLALRALAEKEGLSA